MFNFSHWFNESAFPNDRFVARKFGILRDMKINGYTDLQSYYIALKTGILNKSTRIVPGTVFFGTS
jgi:hypothetical protein